MAGCAVCRGTGQIELLDSPCQFCNGTGERSPAAEAYLKSHTCQCILLDKKRCPVCAKKCHHDTPNRPKVLEAGDGPGGAAGTSGPGAPEVPGIVS